VLVAFKDCIKEWVEDQLNHAFMLALLYAILTLETLVSCALLVGWRGTHVDILMVYVPSLKDISCCISSQKVLVSSNAVSLIWMGFSYFTTLFTTICCD
jgi:hypothetical protein